MSSEDERAAPTLKKRKVQRACDRCRNKKIKCDGVYIPGSRCSNCTARRVECTYLQVNLNDSYARNYVESLEGRLERMEKLVNKLSGGLEVDVTNEVEGHKSDNERPRASGSRADNLNTIPITPPTTVGLATPRTVDSTPQSDEEDMEFSEELTEGMQQLSIGSQPSRYHGKSSGLVFMRSAMALKDEHAGPSRPEPQTDEQYPWLDAFVEDDFPLLDERSFPPQDLMNVLVNLYFRHINCHLPLLHEPTFKSAIEAGEHLRNGGFGATVLLVCANGSRFARADPRVLLDGSLHPHSAGWRWVSLVDKARRLSFAPAKLHDLQVYVLTALFLQGTAAPHTTWAVIGAGIRAAVDVGAHRKKVYTSTPTVEEELWRRAVWILVGLEWVLGHGLGRPCSIHPEDIDLALPTGCDDEYWLDPEGEPLFRQPSGKPCRVSGFVHSLRLAKLSAYAIQTIYARSKSRTLPGGRSASDDQQEQRVVVELDSTLNKWAESLPSYLRWDSEMEDELFLAQAATLKANYYSFQIAVHRSFASSSHGHSPLSSIICTNAARSSIQVLDVLYKRTGSPWYGNMGILATSGTILMVNVLGLKRSGRAINANQDLELVGKVVEMLRSLRYEMQVAEPLAKMLTEMMSAVSEPLPVPGAPTPPATRSRGVQEPAGPRGTKRPSPPAALPTDGLLHEQHTQSLHTRQQSPSGDLTNIGRGPSFASEGAGASTQLDAPFHIPPDFEFLLSDPSPFALPSDGLGPAITPSLTMPPIGGSGLAGSMRHSPTDQVLFPPQAASAFLHTYNPLPTQAPVMADNVRSGTAGESEFYVAGQHGGGMFGLESLGYDLNMNEAMSLLSSISQSQVGTRDSNDTQVRPYFVDADTAMSSGSGSADAHMPVDNEQTFLSSFPLSVLGSESWDAYFAQDGVNNPGL